MALYRFDESDGSAIVDATGNHPGFVVGKEGTEWDRVDGPEPCQRALRFTPSETATPYAVVPNHTELDLSQGSIELWVRFDAPPPAESVDGILSRDANGTDLPGHFSFFRACDGRLVIRLQRSDTQQLHLCSDPVEQDRWLNVGINFGGGPVELFVDGAAAANTEPYACNPGKPGNPCGTGDEVSEGLDGNTNPWVIGALNWTALEGSAEPVQPLHGAIDALHFRNTRQSF